MGIGTRPVTFARFMEYCLYDPQVGYYRSGRPIFGPEGDYLTSPYLHPLFSELLAEAVAAHLKPLSDGVGPLDLVELGAGEGVLARRLLDYLSRRYPRLSRLVRYRAVDLSRPALPRRIRGVVFSNEFFDALPVHRVRIREGRPREIYVAKQDRAFRETEGPLSDPAIEQFLELGFSLLREGAVYEANLEMVRILKKLDQAISRGVVLTIDYGFDSAEYDSRERPDGTLLCYRKHQVSADPYQQPGSQDITAHVNFEVMRKVGDRLGWLTEPLVSQRQFLLQWGLEERLLEEEQAGLLRGDRAPERVALKNLLLPGGVCDVMKVLEQRVR